MEEVLFFQFFEKMKNFREKFVMTKFEEHEISFFFHVIYMIFRDTRTILHVIYCIILMNFKKNDERISL